MSLLSLYILEDGLETEIFSCRNSQRNIPDLMLLDSISPADMLCFSIPCRRLFYDLYLGSEREYTLLVEVVHHLRVCYCFVSQRTLFLEPRV